MHIDSGATVGVLGAGAMGTGIAQVAASFGHPVVLVDASSQALDHARTALETAMRRAMEKGRMDESKAAGVLAKVRFSSVSDAGGMDAFAGCALVIEAIKEQLDVKRDAFTRLEAAVDADCVLGTNTSSLPIAGIASACSKPERVIGIHFFNPAPVMPLVEIIPWLGTAPDVAAGTRTLLDGWQKTTVVASDTPGFIVNRVARPFYGEALRIHDEGIADAATIDWAMSELGGFRMGPFAVMDLIGNDVNFAVTSSVFQAYFYDRRYTPSITQQRLVEAGRLGRKSGRGFYDYHDGATNPQPTADAVLGRHILDRILAMLINEAVDAVHWRVASPADVDLAVTKGVNYPKGLIAWGKELGLDRILGTLVGLQDEYGEDRYRPSPLLKRLAHGAKDSRWT
jgi:3-hydroxybutyryl-CoA dehydrogenase